MTTQLFIKIYCHLIVLIFAACLFVHATIYAVRSIWTEHIQVAKTFKTNMPFSYDTFADTADVKAVKNRILRDLWVFDSTYSTWHCKDMIQTCGN